VPIAGEFIVFKECIGMATNFARMLLAGCAVLWVGAAFAQDAPAFKNASPQEKARLQALIDGAKKEGSVSYWDAVVQPQTNEELTAAFLKHYGLPSSFKVNYTLSSTLNLITRVDQEMGAGRVTIDVAAVASPSWVFEHIKNGDVLKYESPEYKNYGEAFSRGLGEDGYFAFNGGYIFVPMWNEDNFKFKGKSYKDVIGAVPAGRISVGDATKSATYLTTYYAHAQILPKSFFTDLAKMKPSFVVRSEQIASRLVSGEDLLAYSGMPTRAYQNNKKGAHLKFLIPEEGVLLLPQSQFILAKAPHPNAAKLWIDFVLSEEGQTIIVKDEAMMSGRSGFKSPIPDYAPSIDNLKTIKIDWKTLTTPQLKKIRNEWTSIFNP
jgi:iron(III) transport system substrate-binding protein